MSGLALYDLDFTVNKEPSLSVPPGEPYMKDDGSEVYLAQQPPLQDWMSGRGDGSLYRNIQRYLNKIQQQRHHEQQPASYSRRTSLKRGGNGGVAAWKGGNGVVSWKRGNDIPVKRGSLSVDLSLQTLGDMLRHSVKGSMSKAMANNRNLLANAG